MAKFSKRFVSIVFSMLAIAFLVSTASVLIEFNATDLEAILASNSYLFIFFPTLGIVALAAFYLPATIFADLYLNNDSIWLKLRFTIGTLLAIGASLWFARHLNETNRRGVWEASPAALLRDASLPGHCLEGRNLCARAILPTLHDLRAKATDRLHLSPLARQCNRDPLTEATSDFTALRYCFPADAMLDADQCCRVGEAFAKRLNDLYRNPATRSQAAMLDRYLLPFKCFFVIIIIIIGVMLVLWKNTLKAKYGPCQRDMERGLQIGAVAMLLWPVMDYAYQLTSDLLYGQVDKLPLRLSLVMLPWALLLTFHFKDRLKEDARLYQVLGTGASAVAFFVRSQDISDWSAKLVGVGANMLALAVLAGLSLVLVLMLCGWLKGMFTDDEGDDAPVDEPAPADVGPGPLT